MRSKFIPVLVISIIANCLVAFASESDNLLPDKIRALVAKNYPGYRLAKPSDFIGALLKLRDPAVSIVADLNDDGINDYTLQLVHPGMRVFRFVSFISGEKQFKSFELSSSTWPPEHDGKLWQMMWLKKAGSYGMGQEKYFNAPGKAYPYLGDYTEKDIREYKRGVEEYRQMNVIEKSDSPFGAFEWDDFFYCKIGYYFVYGRLASVRKCD